MEVQSRDEKKLTWIVGYNKTNITFVDKLNV